MMVLLYVVMLVLLFVIALMLQRLFNGPTIFDRMNALGVSILNFVAAKK